MLLNKRDQNLGAVITLFAIALFLLYVIFVLGLNNQELSAVVFGVLLLSAIGTCFFLINKYRKENTPGAIDYLNVGTQRHLLGLFMIFYGVPKLFGGFFDYQLFALDSKMGDVSEFELAWYFYGKNRWQELFSGIMEFIPGIMLLSRRRYYLGAVLLLPVTAQVFILNLFFKIGGVTFPAAAILLACNLYILYSQKEKIIQFIRSLDFKLTTNFSSRTMLFFKACKWAVILAAVLLTGKRIKNTFFTSNKQYQSLVGMYTLEHMTKNNSAYTPTAQDSLYYKDLYIEKQSRWNILRRFNNKTDAFVLDLSDNDSVALYINTSGIGDSPDVRDSVSVVRGTYTLKDNALIIQGIQQRDTLILTYRRQNLHPKQWFW